MRRSMSRVWLPSVATLAALAALFTASAPLLAETVRPTQEFSLVGLLTRQGERQCTASGDVRWLHPRHEIGFVRLVSEGVSLADYEDRIVIATGDVVPAPHRYPVVQRGVCPEMQRRMDWVEGPGGIRIRHGVGPRIPGFLVRRVRAFDGLTVAREGSELVVTFTNPLPETLIDVVLTMHYEGCYGKPGAMTQEMAFHRLRPKQRALAHFPLVGRIAGGSPGREVHRAWSIQVQGSAEDAAFDLDVPVNHFEKIDAGCPRAH